MAYEFTKLSEVDIATDPTDNINLLIEENGDIKRINKNNIIASQVQADWDEVDEDSPAFILNKPESLGGANITWFTLSKDGNLYRGYNSTYINANLVNNGYEVISAADCGIVKIFNQEDSVSGYASNVIFYEVNTYMKRALIYYSAYGSQHSISMSYSGPTSLPTSTSTSSSTSTST